MERVELAYERHAERQRWRNGEEWDLRAVKVAVGELLDRDGWYVRCYGGGRDGARAWTGPKAEHYARRTAARWMRTIGGEWVQA